MSGGGSSGTAPMRNAIPANQGGGWNSGPGWAGGNSGFSPGGGARSMGGTGAPQEPMQNPGALTPAGQASPPPQGYGPLQSPGTVTPAGNQWAGPNWGPGGGGGGWQGQKPMYSGLGAGQFNFPNMSGWQWPANLNFGGGGSMK